MAYVLTGSEDGMIGLYGNKKRADAAAREYVAKGNEIREDEEEQEETDDKKEERCAKKEPDSEEQKEDPKIVYKRQQFSEKDPCW